MLEQRLPIYRYKRRILDTVKRSAVTLLMAETGAGKSTQVVQYLHHHLFQVPAPENWRDCPEISYFLKIKYPHGCRIHIELKD